MSERAAPGRVLGRRYRLERLLARGGMASVWVAEDELLARRVAVKTLHPELAADESVRARFRSEARAAATLAHPNVVTTFDTGEDDGIAYIVMELVDGPSLRAVLDRDPTPPVQQVIDVGIQVASALEHAHARGLVHRDVKPANVLVPPEGPVKVTDFGIAKVAGGRDLTRTGTIVGTARYLAPEQVAGQPADARSDVYALGLVLYEMLAGQPAFGGESDMQAAVARLGVDPPPLRDARPDLPPGLERVVLDCLERDPDARRATAASVCRDLEAVRAGSPRPDLGRAAGRPATTGDAAPTHSTGEGAARPTGRAGSIGRVLGALLLLAAGAAAGFVVTDRIVDDASPGAADRGPAPRVVGAADFDPEGDNGRENPGQVPFAIDGDPGTGWSTERYNTPDFGRAKAGVGLRIDLAEPATVHRVEVDTSEGGWSARVYVADGPAADLAGWGAPRAATTDSPANAVIALDPAARGRSVLLWITRLPPSGRLTINEVRVS